MLALKLAFYGDNYVFLV